MRVKFDDGTAKYCCDWCKCNFTVENMSHFSLKLGKRSGWTAPSDGRKDKMPGWRFTRLAKPRRLHFCDTACMARLFAAILIEDSPEYVLR